MHIFSNILSVAKKVALFACVLMTLALVARLQPEHVESGMAQIAVINLIEVQEVAANTFADPVSE